MEWRESIKRTITGYFDNLNEKRRPCILCGQQLYPESRLVKKDGQYYCHEHYDFRFRRDELDKFVPKIDEEKVFEHISVVLAEMPFELDDEDNLMPRVIAEVVSWAAFELDSEDNLMPTIASTHGDDHFDYDSNGNLMPRVA